MILHRFPVSLAFLFLAALAAGQTPITRKVSMECFTGLDSSIGMVRYGTWFPLTVLVTNDNDVGFEAAVEIIARDQTDSVVFNIVKPIYIARNSKRRFLYPLSGYPSIARCEVQLIDNKNYILAEQSLQLNTAKPFDELLLVVGRNRDGIKWANRPTPAEGVPRRRLFYTDIEQMPSEWLAFQSVHTVCFQDAEYGLLGSSQMDALRDWVAWGGHLVVSAGAGAQGLRGSSLAELLPAHIGDIQAISLSWSDLIQGAHDDRSITTIAVASLEDISGEVILDVSGIPLVVSRRMGQGRVTLAAFSLDDAALNSWSGSKWLADVLFSPLRPAAELRNPPNWEDPNSIVAANRILQSKTSVRVPPARFIGMLFAAYLFVAVPIAYLLARRFLRPAYAWISLPVVAVGFSIGIYGLIYRTFSSREQMAVLALFETAPGSTMATGRAVYNIYSPTRGIRRFSMNPDRNIVQPFVEETGAGFLGSRNQPPEVRVEDGRTLLSFDYRPQTWEIGRMDGAMDLNGDFDFSLTLDEANQTVRAVLSNNTVLDLHQVSITGCRWWSEIGDLPANASMTVNVSWPAYDLNESVIVPSNTNAPVNDLPSFIGSSYLTIIRERETLQQAVAVIAYATTIPWALKQEGGSILPDTASVFVVRLPVNMATGYRSARIPRRALFMGFGPMFGSPESIYGNRPFVPGIYGKNLTCTSLWMAGPLPSDTWELASVGPHPDYQPRIYSFYDRAQGKWVDSPDGAIPPAAWDPLRGSVLVRPGNNETWDGQDALKGDPPRPVARFPPDPVIFHYTRKAEIP